MIADRGYTNMEQWYNIIFDNFVNCNESFQDIQDIEMMSKNQKHDFLIWLNYQEGVEINPVKENAVRRLRSHLLYPHEDVNNEVY